MKKFRNLLVLAFSAFLTVGVIAGCNDNTDTTPTDSESVEPSDSVTPSESTPDTPSDSEPEVSPSDSEPETPSDSEPAVPAFNAALDIKEYLEESYKETSNVMANFNLPTTQNTFDLQDNPIQVQIAWNLEVHAGGVEGAIAMGDVVDGKQTFTVKYSAEDSYVATNFTITGTITDPDGNSETITFNWSVPTFEFCSFEDFAQLAKDKSKEVVNVAGTVIAVYKDGLYFEDANGDGFYAYRPTGFVATEYSVGDQILTSGTATSYNSQYEFNSGCTVKLLSEAPAGYKATYQDLTEVFASAKGANDADVLDAHQNSLVEVKGVTVDTFSAEKDNQLYYYFQIGNVRTYLRPYSGWINPATNAAYTMDEINALVSEWNKGYTADIKGVLSIYGGNYYLSLVDNDAITYTSKELADDIKAANSAEAAASSFKDTYLMGHKFDLPATGQNDAALSFVINSEAAKIDENGDLVVTPLANDTTVSVAITATVNGQVGSYTTNFVVKGTEYTTIDAAKAVELAGKLDGSKNETSTEWYYVSGTVGEIYNTQYCNFYIPTADNDQALVVYGLWTGYDSGENRYGSNREIAEIPVNTGDEVVLYTQLQNYNGKLELVNARLISTGTPVVQEKVEFTFDSAIDVFTSASENIELGEYAIAVDANGKVIYASAFAGGYGGPADGFYHDGSYQLVPGQQCGIFAVDAQFAGWPTKLEDGTAAWKLYTVKAPEGVTIYSGTAAQMLPVVNAIFGADLTELAGNAYLEGLTDGSLNHKVVTLTEAEPEVPAEPIVISASFSKAFSEGFTYITNNPSYPNAAWYSDGGLKMNYENMGVLSGTFEASSKVTVALNIKALNQNTKTGKAGDCFVVYGLDANGNVVAQAGLATVTKGSDNVVTLEGEGIVQVKVMMAAYPHDGAKYCNVSLGGVTITAEQ